MGTICVVGSCCWVEKLNMSVVKSTELGKNDGDLEVKSIGTEVVFGL